jgi:hypothetical protein
VAAGRRAPGAWGERVRHRGDPVRRRRGDRWLPLGFFARSASWLGLPWAPAGALVTPEVLPQVQDASEATIAPVATGLLVGAGLIGNALAGAGQPPARRVGRRAADQVACHRVGRVPPTLAHVPGDGRAGAPGHRPRGERSLPRSARRTRRCDGSSATTRSQVFDDLTWRLTPGPAPHERAVHGDANQVVLDLKVQGIARSSIQRAAASWTTTQETNAHVVVKRMTTVEPMVDAGGRRGGVRSPARLAVLAR